MGINNSKLSKPLHIHKNRKTEPQRPLHPGIVISNFGKTVEIKASNGNTIICNYQQNLGTIIVGDHVLWQSDCHSQKGVICQVLPRKNTLKRPNKLSRKHKEIAANIDQIIIMLAPEPAPIEHYIDRYLVAANHMNIDPVIVINKIDLLSFSNNQQQINSIYTLYQKLGYNLLMLSALTHQQLGKLTEILTNKTSVFVGQSGVGKSATINALSDKAMAKTGKISTHNKRGKHTTATARLYHLDSNLGIIDAPGIREFGIWHLSAHDVFAGFPEFNTLTKPCEFRNCRHLESSKGCAIVEAVNQQLITKQRFINYHRLVGEINTLGGHNARQ